MSTDHGPPGATAKLKNAKKTIFVKGIHPVTTETKIYEVFSKFGDVARVDLVRDISKYTHNS